MTDTADEQTSGGKSNSLTAISNLLRDSFLLLFLIAIHSKKGWLATARHGVKKKKEDKNEKYIGKLTGKNPSLPEFTWRRGVVVITTAQLHSTKLKLRFYAGLNPFPGVSEIRDGEDLWQWSGLEIRLNVFRRSTIPQK